MKGAVTVFDSAPGEGRAGAASTADSGASGAKGWTAQVGEGSAHQDSSLTRRMSDPKGLERPATPRARTDRRLRQKLDCLAYAANTSQALVETDALQSTVGETMANDDDIDF